MRLFICLLIISAVAIVVSTNYAAPWRHRITNFAIAWAVLGTLSAIVSIAWWALGRWPK